MTERDYASIISANLRRIANAAGKTQADICHDLHLGKSTVSSWFTGDRTPRMDKVDMLCRYFGVSRAELMEPITTPRIETLSQSELNMLRTYRRLTAYQRGLADAMLAALEKSEQ